MGSQTETLTINTDVDFTDPGFAMRIEGTGYHGNTRDKGAFYISRDRGSNWLGPFSFNNLTDCPELKSLEITARTDYCIEGPHQCLFFMSARGGALTTDKVFCARTSDSGRSFSFISWIVPLSDPYRAVMPSTVQCPSGDLVSAIRRREPGSANCWIDVYISRDAGETWKHSGRAAETGGWNGNPPALTVMANGTLCCVFGERETCRMIARYSPDQGKTWNREFILRDDFECDRFKDPDLGYPRVTRLEDGRMLSCYYWATEQAPHQHIAATIWDAGADI